MPTVLRVTRHPASPEQAAALERAVTRLAGPGPLRVVEHGQTVQSAAEVLALAEEHGADVIEAVLPPPLLADLTSSRVNTRGIPVIRAQMAREVDAAGNATFAFIRYERIIKVEVVAEPLD